MFDLLNSKEKEILHLLIQGHNFYGISQFCCIDYSEYKKIKQSIFKKLNIKRSTEILKVLLQNGINAEDV